MTSGLRSHLFDCEPRGDPLRIAVVSFEGLNDGSHAIAAVRDSKDAPPLGVLDRALLAATFESGGINELVAVCCNRSKEFVSNDGNMFGNEDTNPVRVLDPKEPVLGEEVLHLHIDIEPTTDHLLQLLQLALGERDDVGWCRSTEVLPEFIGKDGEHCPVAEVWRWRRIPEPEPTNREEVDEAHRDARV